MADLFPLREFRGHEAADLSVKAIQPSAQAVIIDTNFDGPTADALAAAALAATKNRVSSYAFDTPTTLKLSDIVGAPPVVSITAGSIDNYATKLVTFRTDWTRGVSAVTVRGR